MGYSYSRDWNKERKEWFKLIDRYIRDEWSRGFEFYCFSLLMNDYRYVGRKRVWGNRFEYEESLKLFYNLLNRRLYGSNWKKKGFGIKGFICFYEEDDGMKFIKDIGKMNKVKGGHFHIIIKKEKDLSELKIRESIKDIWIKGQNKWNRKFNDEVVKLYPWEKFCYMEWDYFDDEGKLVKERDSYDEDVIVPKFWVGCSCFKFDEFYYSYIDVMDKNGKVKREKYSYLNYSMKGKWIQKREMSYDVVRSLREDIQEKISLNSKMM